MRLRRFLLSFGLANLCFNGVEYAVTAQSETRPTVLSAEDMMRILPGNTLLAYDKNGPFWMYFPEPGTVWGQSSDGDVDIGHWWIDGDQYCRSWRVWYGGSTQCWKLVSYGDNRLLWMDSLNSIQGESVVQRGNAIGTIRMPQLAAATVASEVDPVAESATIGPSRGCNHPMPPPTVPALAPDRMRGKAPAVTRAAVHRAGLPPAMMAPADKRRLSGFRLTEALEGAAAAAPPAQRRAATPQVAHPQAEARRAATPQVAHPLAEARRAAPLPAAVRQPAAPRAAVRQGASAAAEIQPEVRLPGETPAPATAARTKGVPSAAAIRARGARAMARAKGARAGKAEAKAAVAIKAAVAAIRAARASTSSSG
jgi:hypothetical protein